MRSERQDFFGLGDFLPGRYFTGFTPRSLQIFLAKISFISVAGVWRNVCSTPGYATTNALPLLSIVRNPAFEDVSAACFFSYGNFFFNISIPGVIQRILTIKLQGFHQGYPQGFLQFIQALFLAVHLGDFRYPADPPVAFLLYECGVLIIHFSSNNFSLLMGTVDSPGSFNEFDET
jgi:hypothetical protein